MLLRWCQLPWLFFQHVALPSFAPRPTAFPAGRPQVTVRLALRDYVAYYEAACAHQHRTFFSGGGQEERADAAEADAERLAPAAAPFYLNGWAAAASHPEALAQDCPPPYFTELIDHSELILAQLDKQLFSSKRPAAAAAPGGEAAAAAAVPSTAAASTWWQRLSLGLSKLFMGPAGTVTRLHFDAGAPPLLVPSCLGSSLLARHRLHGLCWSRAGPAAADSLQRPPVLLIPAQRRRLLHPPIHHNRRRNIYLLLPAR